MKNLTVIAIAVFLAATGVVASQEAGVCRDASATLDAFPAPNVQQGATRVGDSVETRIDTPHPYVGLSTTKAQLVFSREIHHPGASFVSPHFGRFELAEGDYVIVRSPDYSRSWRYEDFGKKERGKEGNGGFWGIHITGENSTVASSVLNRERSSS